MKSAIEKKLTQAAHQLLRTQPTLFQFTSATHQSEWNIAHHFANALQAEFPDYDCDTDVIKPGTGKKRPDVIIHRRGSHEHNLLVVEVKRILSDVDREAARIATSWFRPPMNYRFGAVVVIADSEIPYIVVLQNADWTSPTEPEVG